MSLLALFYISTSPQIFLPPTRPTLFCCKVFLQKDFSKLSAFQFPKIKMIEVYIGNWFCIAQIMFQSSIKWGFDQNLIFEPILHEQTQNKENIVANWISIKCKLTDIQFIPIWQEIIKIIIARGATYLAGWMHMPKQQALFMGKSCKIGIMCPLGTSEF